MSYQSFVALQQLSAAQMNQLQQSVYTFPQTVISGVSHTLALANSGHIIKFTNAGQITVSIQLASTTNFPIGTSIALVNSGTGTVTVTGAAGVTVNTESNLAASFGQSSIRTLLKIDTNSWVMSVTPDPLSTLSIIDEKSTSYTLVLTDSNKFIKMNIASAANTVMVPTNASVAWPIGTQIHVIQYGSGKTQVAPVSGTVIIYATPGNFLRAQYSSATLLKCDTNLWMLMGDLSAT